LNVSGDLTWFDYCFTPDPTIPDCVEKQLTVNETFTSIPPTSNQFVYRDLDSCTNNEFVTAQYLVSANISFTNTLVIEEPVLEIEFDCVPPNPNVSLSPFRICDAQINIEAPGAYLSTIVDRFNLLLAGRVVLRDLTGGKFYVGCGTTFTRNESTISNGRLKITYFANHNYFSACVNAFVSAGVTPCPLTTGGGYFETVGLLDGWNMSTLIFRPCPCVPVNDNESEFLCEYCGTNYYGAQCPPSSLNVSGSIFSI
jgi:hypothetical protein